MLRRLNRVAPAKKPDPFAELSAVLDGLSEEELLALKARLIEANAKTIDSEKHPDQKKGAKKPRRRPAS
jgi:hypothetical protein